MVEKPGWKRLYALLAEKDHSPWESSIPEFSQGLLLF